MNKDTQQAVAQLVKAGVVHNEVDFILRYGDNKKFPPGEYVFWRTKHKDGQNHKVRFCYSSHQWCDKFWSWKTTVVKRTQLRITELRTHALRKDAEACARAQQDRWDWARTP